MMMKKKEMMFFTVLLLLIPLLTLTIAPVSAASVDIGFSGGDTFAWKKSTTSYNEDGSVNETVISYLKYNNTVKTVMSNNITVEIDTYTTNESEYNDHGATGEEGVWSWSLPVNVDLIDDEPETQIYSKFIAKNLKLTTVNNFDESTLDQLFNVVQEVDVAYGSFLLTWVFHGTPSISTTTTASEVWDWEFTITSTQSFTYNNSGHIETYTYSCTLRLRYSLQNGILLFSNQDATYNTKTWSGSAFEFNDEKTTIQYEIAHPQTLVDELNYYYWYIWVPAIAVGVILILYYLQKKGKIHLKNPFKQMKRK
ncbi:MAG: hypothetical protein ACFFCS_22780 [Candidatus Hodarchaeota archaeon]